MIEERKEGEKKGENKLSVYDILVHREKSHKQPRGFIHCPCQWLHCGQ